MRARRGKVADHLTTAATFHAHGITEIATVCTGGESRAADGGLHDQASSRKAIGSLVIPPLLKWAGWLATALMLCAGVRVFLTLREWRFGVPRSFAG